MYRLVSPYAKYYKICAFLIVSNLSWCTFAQAAPTEVREELSKTTLEQSTQDSLVEIANLQVFKEICPTLIGKNANLDHGIDTMLATFLPTKNVKLAMKALNEEDYYQPILRDARKEVSSATQEDNRQVCLSIVHWDKNKPKQ